MGGRLVAVALLPLLTATSGCLAAGGCTDVGGVTAISVNLSRAVDVRTGTLLVEVCYPGQEPADCASFEESLPRPPERRPAGRQVHLKPADLDQRKQGERLEVSVEVIGPSGSTVAARTGQVELSRYYPNGVACDGNGYISGEITLTVVDRVGSR